jgi:hypothetical protein
LEKEIDGIVHHIPQQSRALHNNFKQQALKSFIIDKIAPEVDIRPEFMIDEGSELQVL